jgi:hypothetical protein
MVSVVTGIGAFRTHASPADDQGRNVYRLKSEQARLAIHSTHTLAVFTLEARDERASTAIHYSKQFQQV